MKKLYRFLVLILPIILYFSYFPVISLGSSETMNFELSLPLIWLVVFDIVACVMMICKKKCGKILKKWWWWMFPIFATMSLAWSANVVRGVLTVGTLWLVYIAVCAFVALEETVHDAEFKKKWWRVFFSAAIVACAWCVTQCIMDALGVPRENSLMCAGCVSEMFGFPHPNGFAIEPQFMGNLLLAPAIVAMNRILVAACPSDTLRAAQAKSSRSVEHTATKILFAFIFSSTIFLTFSRGAIYAFVVALVFMTALMIVRTKSAKVLILWPVVILSFLFTLNLQGILAEVGPTNDTYASGISKVINHLSLGIIDIRQNDMENVDDEEELPQNEAVFDGYVEESTDTRVRLTEAAMKVWTSDFRTAMVGVGIGGAGQAMYDAGVTDSPKEIVQNEYASLLVEVGAVGVALVIFTIVMIVKWLIKNGGESNSLLFSSLVAYAVTLMFFSGFANALQIYLLPVAIVMML